MPDTLRDRVILISGATGGLGSAVVREFASTEAHLALTSTSGARLEGLIADIGLTDGRALFATADVTHADDVASLVSAILDKFGRIDALLNTVGTWSGGKPVSEIATEAWDRLLALNLRSAFLLSRAVLPPMLEAGWGRIVHVSSKIAVEPRAKQAEYAVSKMGLIALTEVIAAEVKGTGVTANVILPSIIAAPGRPSSSTGSGANNRVPPEHIAAAMRFLCSDAGASINGARIPIYAAV
jgi:NAD(P)-dependent dehydrogenase (short-subunit alcohol dehydrogenase family)